jgi:hypothetical protein
MIPRIEGGACRREMGLKSLSLLPLPRVHGRGWCKMSSGHGRAGIASRSGLDVNAKTRAGAAACRTGL